MRMSASTHQIAMQHPHITLLHRSDYTAPPMRRPPLSGMMPPPYHALEPVKAPPKRTCRRPDRPPMQCANCGVLDTPLWRKASDGSGATLCNACGIYLKTHNVRITALGWCC